MGPAQRSTFSATSGPDEPDIGRGEDPREALRAALAVPSEPFYVRVRFQRKGQPGSASVATANVVNPCPEGTYPVVMAE